MCGVVGFAFFSVVYLLLFCIRYQDKQIHTLHSTRLLGKTLAHRSHSRTPFLTRMLIRRWLKAAKLFLITAGRAHLHRQPRGTVSSPELWGPGTKMDSTHPVPEAVQSCEKDPQRHCLSERLNKELHSLGRLCHWKAMCFQGEHGAEGRKWRCTELKLVFTALQVAVSFGLIFRVLETLILIIFQVSIIQCYGEMNLLNYLRSPTSF